MRLNYKNIFILICGLGLVACEPEIDDIPTASSGEADFSTYVALGNSLTAGYSDGALYLEAQQNSYPSIIAGQFSEVGGGAFTQPLVPAGNGFGGLNANNEPNGKLILSLASGSPSPVRTPGDVSVLVPVSGPFNNFGVPGAKAGNLMMPGYGSDMGNPFFARFASSPAATIVADAVSTNPTFFTLWIGNNDVLGYATSGGEGDVITETGAFSGAIDNIIAELKLSNATIEGAIANIPNITKIPYFTTVPWNGLALDADQAILANASYEQNIVNSEGGLGDQVEVGVVTTVVITTGVATEAVFTQAFMQAKAAGASDSEAQQIAGSFVASPEGQLAIGVLRDILLQDEVPTEYTDLKATTTYLIENPEERPGELTTAIDGLLAANELPEDLALAVESEIENQVTMLKSAGFYPTFAAGANAFVIEDEDNPANPLGIRQMRQGELILISALGDGLLAPSTAAMPKPDQYILDASELSAIETARTAYNEKLESKAEAEGFAFVDMAGFFDDVAVNPLLLDGVTYSTTFVTGNVFSLDGVHLTQAGAAIVANEFIKSINSHYNASVPPVANVSAYEKVTLP